MPAVACMSVFHFFMLQSHATVFSPCCSGLTGRPFEHLRGYQRYNRFGEIKEKEKLKPNCNLACALGDLGREPPCVPLLPDRYW